MNAATDLSQRAADVVTLITEVEYALADGDLMAAIRAANRAADKYSALVADIVQNAYDAGESKAALARALGVPVSMFRGMVRS